jgi:formimidoylglutamate deiminase
MNSLYARKALLPSGWATGVRLCVSDGRIESVDAGTRIGDGDTGADIVLPGICNAHSHAFQRALVGHTERRSPAGQDNFWTWRSEMYRLASRIGADEVKAIARQVYSEMLIAGYTSVVEFHYLHHAGYDAIIAAAEETGIRLTFVPILYERAGFDDPTPDDVQKLFVKSLEELVSLYEQSKSLVSERVDIGIGIHSLRAVSKESIDRIAELGQTEAVPLHIHLAEQQREVDECLSHYKTRPARWLLDHCDVNAYWCIVHATHLEADEVSAIAESGAVVCLCPSTEANLGDGIFPLKGYLDKGGRIAIGSDSQVTVDPFEELRWLEYGQRLRTESRNASVFDGGHSGQTLFDLVAIGGAQACAQQTGRLEPGALADLMVLESANPIFSGHDDDTLLDSLVFSGYPLPIERVMVHGEWRVLDGQHVNQEDIRRDYRQAVEALR